jgi:hypothetical protein
MLNACHCANFEGNQHKTHTTCEQSSKPLSFRYYWYEIIKIAKLIYRTGWGC